MAGFFSLTSGSSSSDRHNSNNNQPKNNNPQQQHHQQQGWYLYRTHDDDHTTIQPSSSYYNEREVGYELWPQLQQQQQQQTLFHPSAVGLGVRGTEVGDHERSEGSPDYNRMMMLRRMSSTGSTGSGTSVGSISCQDCGNQAKKDCVHMRCRTCCKSRGFDCPTHIKSTWVPASVRRSRHQTLLAEAGQVQGRQEHAIGQPQTQQPQIGYSKRRRENPVTASSSSSLACTQLPTANAATTITTTTTTTTTAFAGMELGNFPPEVSSPAVFRCVRVSSVDDTEEEVAYQTAVSIGGHVFKGILYDQGPADDQRGIWYIGGGGRGGESSSGGGPPLDTTAGATTSGAGPSSAVTIAASSPHLLGYLDPSLYPVPLNSYMSSPGTQFFSNPRP